jgi:hypothetical protein
MIKQKIKKITNTNRDWRNNNYSIRKFTKCFSHFKSKVVDVLNKRYVHS